MPVFCGDFLIFAEKYLLIKKERRTIKDVYWVIGGRLRFKETMAELAERVMKQEIGRSFTDFKRSVFKNFPDVPDARATHTPTLYILFLLRRF